MSAKDVDVIVVRAYLREDRERRAHLLERLHDWGKVRGVTSFQGARGFGEGSGGTPSSPPIVVEFFEEPAKAMELVDYLDTVLPPGHVVYWPAKLRVAE